VGTGFRNKIMRQQEVKSTISTTETSVSELHQLPAADAAAHARFARPRRVPPPAPLAQLAQLYGLHLVKPEALTISRRRHGRGFAYYDADGVRLRDRAAVSRLASLAVPPAYINVRCAEDPAAHLQAIGQDVAGRLQYRYHPEWEKVRELRKARRLMRLAGVLPRIRRSVAQHLAAGTVAREAVLAAVIELVARSAIRPGSEEYARIHGTRGAATLLKSNVATEGDKVILSFRGKGGKIVRKEFTAPLLVPMLERLRELPGRRLFQYRDGANEIHMATARAVNAFLREIAGGVAISLKDFRTLLASAAVLEALARQVPATSARQRRRQVLEAVRKAAEDLANTPAICRRSYVHASVVAAFEDGVLEGFAETLKKSRSAARREQLLTRIMAIAA
jgi:DNA topoisomerase I